MKIGLVCPYNMFRGGGVQECVLALRDGIVARGHEAQIITPQPLGSQMDSPDGILFAGTARAIRAAHTYADISVSIETEKLEELLSSENFDVLHFHEPWIPILSRQILTRSSAVHVATFHAAMSERRTSKMFEKVITPYTKSILGYIDVMTTVSPTAAKYVKSLTRRKLNVIPNGIDLAKYQTNRSANKVIPKTILYIGRLEKRKGVKYLIDAFKILQANDPEYSLIIAGDGPERQRLEDQVARYGLNNVTFLGYIEESDKLRLLQTSAVFCSPALYGESFGIVLLEAMAAGCVTVAGNNAGYASVMTGRGGLSLVNPKDSDEFARRLQLLATDDALRSAWIDWASQHITLFDYEKVIDSYVALYQEAYAKHKK